MATDIGPKIGIEGEAQFRSDLNKLTLQLKTMGTEMKAVTSAFDKNDQSQEKLSAQSDVLNRQIAAQTEKLSLLQEMLEKSKAAYGENDDRVLKWQQQVNNATAALNRMKAQLRETETGLSGVDDKLDNVTESTSGTAKGFGDMKIALAILVADGIKTAISAIGNLVSSLVNLDESTEEFRIAQGKVNTAFESAGYGADAAKQAYAEFYEILGDTGTAAEASQLLAKLTDNEKDLSKWTEVAAGVSGTFGDSLPINGLIEAANETAKVGQVTGVLADALNWAGISEDEFNEKLAAASSESERNRLIMDTLSQTYDDAAAAFYRNNETLVEARKNQVLMDQALSGLGETIADIKNQVRSEFTPALSDLVGAFGDMLRGADGASDAFGKSLSGLLQTVSTSLPRFLSAGASIIASVSSGVIEAMPALLEALVVGISSLFHEIVNLGVQIMLRLSAGIDEGLPQMLAQLPAVIDGIIDYITTELPQMLAAGQEILMNLVTGIVGSIPMLMEGLPQIIASLATFFVEQGPTIVQMGVQVLMDLVSGIIQAIPQLIAAVPQLITSLVETLITEGPRIFTAGVEILGTLISGIIGALPELGAAVLQILEAILQGFTDIWEDIKSIGENIVKGIKQGISDAWSSFTSFVKSKFEGLVSGVKGLFGIHSPSRVFRDQVGKMLMLGLAEGIQGGIGVVGTALQDTQTTVLAIADEMNRRLIEKEAELSDAIKAEGLDTVTKAALEEQLQAVKTFRSEYEQALSDLQKKQDSMAEKLKNYGELFTTVKTKSGSFLELNDLQSDIDAIDRYGEALEQLKQRGVSDTLMNEIVGLDVDSATAYVEKLIAMTDAQYNEYMALWEEKQRAAADVAERFYSDEMTALVDEYVSKVPDALGTMKDELYEVGQMAAKGLAQGILSQESYVASAARDVAAAAREAVRLSEGIHSPAKKWAILGDYMAQGIGVGFEKEMKSVASRMQNAIPVPTIDTVQNMASSMMNGLSALNNSMGEAGPITINLILPDGQAFATWQLPYLRSVMRANPEVVNDT